jgi:hypothetical protein
MPRSSVAARGRLSRSFSAATFGKEAATFWKEAGFPDDIFAVPSTLKAPRSKVCIVKLD